MDRKASGPPVQGISPSERMRCPVEASGSPVGISLRNLGPELSVRPEVTGLTVRPEVTRRGTGELDTFCLTCNVHPAHSLPGAPGLRFPPQ